MMKLRDALAIATIKLKTRKFRTAFAGFSISIGIVIILAFLFGTTGVVRMGNDMFVDSLSSRSFAIEQYQNGYTKTFDEVTGDLIEVQNQDVPVEATDLNAYRGAHPEVINAYQQIRADGAYGLGAVDGETSKALQQNSAVILATDGLFVGDMVREGFQFDSLIDGKVPVIIPENMLIAPDDYGFVNPENNAKERYESTQALVKDVVGKTFHVEDRSVEGGLLLDFDVIVVGVEPTSVLFGSTFLEGAITVPLWAMTDVPTVVQLYESVPKAYRVVAEFSTKEDRDAFVKKSFDAMAFGSIDEQPKSFVNAATTVFDQLHEVATFFRSIGFGIGGFFLAISGIMIMTTLGKIIADSQKEIAVFRAVGAHKRDIKKMYFGYAWLLATIGFVIGTVLAIALDVIASLKWGDTVYYQFAGQAVRVDFVKPLFVFLGFTPLEWALVYLGVVLFGLLAALLPVRRASKIDPISVLREL